MFFCFCFGGGAIPGGETSQKIWWFLFGFSRGTKTRPRGMRLKKPPGLGREQPGPGGLRVRTGGHSAAESLGRCRSELLGVGDIINI